MFPELVCLPPSPKPPAALPLSPSYDAAALSLPPLVSSFQASPSSCLDLGWWSGIGEWKGLVERDSRSPSTPTSSGGTDPPPPRDPHGRWDGVRRDGSEEEPRWRRCPTRSSAPPLEEPPTAASQPTREEEPAAIGSQRSLASRLSAAAVLGPPPPTTGSFPARCHPHLAIHINKSLESESST